MKTVNIKSNRTIYCFKRFKSKRVIDEFKQKVRPSHVNTFIDIRHHNYR